MTIMRNGLDVKTKSCCLALKLLHNNDTNYTTTLTHTCNWTLLKVSGTFHIIFCAFRRKSITFFTGRKSQEYTGRISFFYIKNKIRLNKHWKLGFYCKKKHVFMILRFNISISIFLFMATKVNTILMFPGIFGVFVGHI